MLSGDMCAHGGERVHGRTYNACIRLYLQEHPCVVLGVAGDTTAGRQAALRVTAQLDHVYTHMPTSLPVRVHAGGVDHGLNAQHRFPEQG